MLTFYVFIYLLIKAEHYKGTFTYVDVVVASVDKDDDSVIK